MSNIICNVPFCNESKNKGKSYCSNHRWEFDKLQIPAYKELLPLWAVKRCVTHGLLTNSQVTLNKSRKIYSCTKCIQQYRKRTYDPKKQSLYIKKNYINYKNHQLNKLYSITIDDYNNILQKQNCKCKICSISFDDYVLNKPKRKYFHVDHCHKTSKIRGLLCWKCNVSIGLLGDTKESLEKVISYLSQYD